MKITLMSFRTPLVSFQVILIRLRIRTRIQYGGGECHRYRLGMSYTCNALRYKPTFIATALRALDFRSKGPRFDPRPKHGVFLIKSP